MKIIQRNILLLLIFLNSVTLSQWMVQNRYPSGASNFYFTEDGIGYAFSGNTIYKKHSANWVPKSKGNPLLTNLFFLNDTIWYSAYDYLYKTTNSGESWTPIYYKPFHKYKFINEYVGWSVGTQNYGSTHHSQGVAKKTEDGGFTWQPLLVDSEWTSFGDLYFLDENNGLVFGTNDYRTTDGGITWEHLYSLPLKNIYPIKDSVFLCTGTTYPDNHTVFKSTDFGNSYTLIYHDQNKWPENFYFKNENFGFIFGTKINSTRFILMTSNGGQIWEDITDSFFGNSFWPIRAISFVNETMGWAADSSLFFFSSDMGNSWKAINRLYTISIVSEKIIFVGGSSKDIFPKTVILKTTDGGTNWKEIGPEFPGSFISSSFVDDNTGWFVGTGSNIINTTDSGESWISYPTGQNKSLRDVVFIDRNTGWAVGDSGTILKSTNGGVSWAPVNYSSVHDVWSISLVNSSTCFINFWPKTAGSYEPGFILRTNDGGITFDTVFTGTFYELQFLNELIGYASTGDKIYKTVNGGNNWIQLSPINAIIRNLFMIDEHTGFVQTGAWEILKTSDGGNSWNIDTIFNNNTTDIKFLNENFGLITLYNGNIMKTMNGGVVTNISNTSSPNSYIKNFKLFNNYPNPFNPTTSIQYTVSSRELVTLKVYDVLGREIATLVNEEKHPGVYEVEFQSSVGSRQLASGIYYYQLIVGNFVKTKKMLLIK